MNARQKAKHYKKLNEQLRAMYWNNVQVHNEMCTRLSTKISKLAVSQDIRADEFERGLTDQRVIEILIGRMVESDDFKALVAVDKRYHPERDFYNYTAYLNALKPELEEE